MAHVVATDDTEGAPEGGTLLAELPRGDGKECIRVSLVTYRGARFASVRVWSRSRAGDYRPTARGVHLRPSELRDIRAALDRAIGPVAGDSDVRPLRGAR